MTPTGHEELDLEASLAASPVTVAEVVDVCRDLANAGQAVTRRSVRLRLGRGSMTTIHKGVTEYESRRMPAAPAINLTAAEKDLISELGARALEVAGDRVHRVVLERETAFQALIAASEARAADAIAAAEASVMEANEARALAMAVRDAMARERDSATVTAGEMDRQCLHLQGQTQQLRADVLKLEQEIFDLRNQVTTNHARCEVEIAARERAEAAGRAVAAELAGLRAEYAVRKEDDANAVHRANTDLAAARARLEEIGRQCDALEASDRRRETQIAEQAGELRTAAERLALAEAAVGERDRTIIRLEDAHKIETGRSQALTVALTDRDRNTDTVATAVRAMSAHGTEIEAALREFRDLVQASMTMVPARTSADSASADGDDAARSEK
jgi:chromosome segregation ATPase